MKKVLICILIACSCKSKDKSWQGFAKNSLPDRDSLEWNAREGDTVGITKRSWSEEALKGMPKYPIMMHTLDENGNIDPIYTTSDSFDYYTAHDRLHRSYHIDNMETAPTMNVWYHKQGTLYPTTWGLYYGLKKGYMKSQWTENVLTLTYIDHEGMAVTYMTTTDSIVYYDKKMGWPQF